MPSEIRVDNINSLDPPDSQVNLPFGAVINGEVTGTGDIIFTGIVSATSFSGDGSGLTGLPTPNQGEVVAQVFLN